MCLFAYLFVFYIVFIQSHHSKKNTLLYYKHAATYPYNIRYNNTKCFDRYTECPTRYRTRNLFNNSDTNEDIATKFEQHML